MKKNYLKQLVFIGLSMFFCANAQGQNAELRSLFAEDDAAVIYMSDNGDWACGSAFNNNDGAGFQSNASKWDLTTGERIYLVAEDELDRAQSDAFCISDDGLLVGGQYLREPAYHLNGEWHVLPMPKGYTMGEVRDFAIVENDTIFVGRIFDGDGFQKIQSAKWVNGEFEKIVDLIPEEYQRDEENKMMNQVTYISTDGKVILGAIKPVYWPQNANIEERIPFIINDGEFKLLSPMNREEFSQLDQNSVRFFQDEKMSCNGRYIALQMFANQTNIPCYYDVKEDKFIIIEEAPENTTCLVVDNEGNPYYGGPVLTGDFRKTYVTIDGTAALIDDVLMTTFGITQEQIDAICLDELLIGSLRWVYNISSDSKTIIGCAGEGSGTYNWVLKLPYPLTEGEFTAVENIVNDANAVFYAEGNINFTNEVDYVEIYNINGQLVQNKEVSASFIPTKLAQGIYVVKAYNANKQITTSKLIIK